MRVLIVTGVVLLSVGAITWAILLLGKLDRLTRRRRHAREVKEVEWRHYSRPSGGSHVVGVERVDGGGLVLNQRELYRFPLDVDEYDRINAEGVAITHAVKYNELRISMDGR